MPYKPIPVSALDKDDPLSKLAMASLPRRELSGTDMALLDLMVFGIHIERDGERVNPFDVFVEVNQ